MILIRFWGNELFNGEVEAQGRSVQERMRGQCTDEEKGNNWEGTQSEGEQCGSQGMISVNRKERG